MLRAYKKKKEAMRSELPKHLLGRASAAKMTRAPSPRQAARRIKHT
jgi:hypothetical protein